MARSRAFESRCVPLSWMLPCAVVLFAFVSHVGAVDQPLFLFGFDFDSCDGGVAAQRGSLVRIEGYLTLTASVEGVAALSQSVEIRLEGGDTGTTFCIDVGHTEWFDIAEREAVLETPIFSVVPDPTWFVLQNDAMECENGAGDSDDPVNQGRRGITDSVVFAFPPTLPSGTTKTLPVAIDVTVGDCDTLELRYVDGLKGPGLPINNAVGFEGGLGDAEVVLETCRIAIGCIENLGFSRGDATNDAAVDITDAIRMLEFLILGTGDVVCHDAADADDSGVLDITDPITLLQVLILGLGEIPAPGIGGCDLGPTDDFLSCDIGRMCGT